MLAREAVGELENCTGAGALVPEAHEVLAEVLVEVVRGGGVGDEDSESRSLERAALELLEPGGQGLAASEGDDIFRQ